MRRQSSLAVLVSFAFAVVLAVAEPDYRHGAISVWVILLLSPLLIAIPLAIASSFKQGLRRWLALFLALVALVVHFLVSVALYASVLGSLRFDHMTYSILGFESIVQVFVVVLVFVVSCGVAALCSFRGASAL